MGSASSGASAARRPRAALALRMSEGEGDKDGKVVDPYEVKLNNGVPSFAKVPPHVRSGALVETGGACAWILSLSG